MAASSVDRGPADPAVRPQRLRHTLLLLGPLGCVLGALPPLLLLVGPPATTPWGLAAAAAGLLAVAVLAVLVAGGLGTLRRLEAAAAALPLPVAETPPADEVAALERRLARLQREHADRLDATARARAERERTLRFQAATDRHTQEFGTAVSGVIGSLAFSAEAMHAFASELCAAASATQDQASGTAQFASESAEQLAAVSDSVGQISASVNEIAARVAGTAAETRRAVERAAASDEAMRDLAEAVGRIGAITGLIRDVASRTNLLALNATIEAARAGEAGKGFAVVASEVKALAAQTARATEEIAGQIAAIQGSTAGAIEAMREVGSTTRRIDEAAAAIAAAVEQQGATAREIATKVQAVSSSTASAATSMGNVSGATEQAKMTSSVVLEAAGEVGRQASTLREELDQFLVAVRGDPAERRRYERVPVTGLAIRVKLPEGDVEAAAIDISKGGIAFRAETIADPGTALEVTLPGDPQPIAARIVRVGEGVVVAAFRQDEQTLERLDRLVDALVPRAAA